MAEGLPARRRLIDEACRRKAVDGLRLGKKRAHEPHVDLLAGHGCHGEGTPNLRGPPIHALDHGITHALRQGQRGKWVELDAGLAGSE